MFTYFVRICRAEEVPVSDMCTSNQIQGKQEIHSAHTTKQLRNLEKGELSDIVVVI